MKLIQKGIQALDITSLYDYVCLRQHDLLVDGDPIHATFKAVKGIRNQIAHAPSGGCSDHDHQDACVKVRELVNLCVDAQHLDWSWKEKIDKELRRLDLVQICPY